MLLSSIIYLNKYKRTVLKIIFDLQYLNVKFIKIVQTFIINVKNEFVLNFYDARKVVGNRYNAVLLKRINLFTDSFSAICGKNSIKIKA